MADAQLADRPLMIEARVPKPPTVAKGSSGSFLIHELHITSLDAAEVRLVRVEVLDATERVVMTLADSALLRDISRPGQGTITLLDRGRLKSPQRASVFLRVPVTGPIDRIHHRLTFTDSLGTRVLTTRPTRVTPEPVRVGPPLRGGLWFAANGPGNTSGHRRALIPVDGTAAIAQRFAIDYVIVDTTFKTHKGDPLKNESYYAENAEAIAVADGRIVAVKDSIPENVPGVNSRAVPITLETIGGNHVILDIGGGHYAFYAHLRPGSLKVKLGDRVKRGAVLGLVGNSGNSTEPHLHFHISDANSPLGSEGVPYVHDAFERVGSCQSFARGCALDGSRTVRGVMPLENEIVRFPR